jgi:hypothetical protein
MADVDLSCRAAKGQEEPRLNGKILHVDDLNHEFGYFKALDVTISQLAASSISKICR